MFVVGIFGGLASQMNQYSFLRCLEKRYPDVQVKMAIESEMFKKFDHQGYELDKVFGIDKHSAPESRLIRMSDFYGGKGVGGWVISKLKKISRIVNGTAVSSQITLDDPTVYFPELLELDPLKDYFFWGNYSYKYFKDYEEDLRGIFNFRVELSGENVMLANEISRTHSVSIHIRHGDYITQGFDVLDMGYYKKAIEKINALIENPTFFIFSDDINYIEYEFGFIENKHVVTNNKGDSSYIDMYLMSLCKNNIIANSGFSWWAAFLNRNNKKIVIGPDRHVSWCKHPLTMDDWIKVGVE